MTTSTDLDRPMYDPTQVDRILALNAGTTRRWVNGYERSGEAYASVLRGEFGGSPIVTWGEFVEARLLAEYRAAGISSRRLRAVIDHLRPTYGPYPLAVVQPFTKVFGRELLLVQQEAADLEAEASLVVADNEQLVLTPVAERFLQSVVWSEAGMPLLVKPNERFADVVVVPDRGFGEPVIDGIRTENIAELVAAGEPIAQVALDYEIPAARVQQAVDYEAWRSAAHSRPLAAYN